MTQTRLTDGAVRVGSNAVVGMGPVLAGSVAGDLSIASGAANRAVRIGGDPAAAAIAVVDAYGLMVNGLRIGTDASNVASGVLPVVRGGTSTSTSTGSGAVVMNSAPYLSNATLSNATLGGICTSAFLQAPVLVGATLSNTTLVGSVFIDASRITSGTLAVARGGTGASTSTGTGVVALNTNPILVSAALSNAVFAGTTTGPIVMSNATLLAGSISGAAFTNTVDIDAACFTQGTLQVSSGGTSVSTSTGGGSVVLNQAPYLSNATLSNSFVGGVTYNATLSNVSLSGVTLSNLSLTSASTSVIIDGSRIASGTVAAAYLPAASTSAAGVVQLVDSVASTSTTLAATAKSVKTAYDLANSINPSNYLQKAGGAMTGSLVLGSNLTLSNAYVTGYVPTPLTYFEETVWTPTYAKSLGSGTLSAATGGKFRFVRAGNFVVAYIEQLAVTVTSAAISYVVTSALPVRFRPRVASNHGADTPRWDVEIYSSAAYGRGIVTYRQELEGYVMLFHNEAVGQWNVGTSTLSPRCIQYAV